MLEKSLVAQPLKKYAAFHGARRFIAVFIRVSHQWLTLVLCKTKAIHKKYIKFSHICGIITVCTKIKLERQLKFYETSLKICLYGCETWTPLDDYKIKQHTIKINCLRAEAVVRVSLAIIYDDVRKQREKGKNFTRMGSRGRNSIT
jgi:predicted transport protein